MLGFYNKKYKENKQFILHVKTTKNTKFILLGFSIECISILLLFLGQILNNFYTLLVNFWL